jgi:hypothetical protein
LGTNKLYTYVVDTCEKFDSKFSTVTLGERITVKPKGYKRGLGGQSARNIPISDVNVCAHHLNEIKHRYGLVSFRIIPPDRWNKESVVELIGRRSRDVDMAGSEVFRNYGAGGSHCSASHTHGGEKDVIADLSMSKRTYTEQLGHQSPYVVTLVSRPFSTANQSSRVVTLVNSLANNSS